MGGWLPRMILLSAVACGLSPEPLAALNSLPGDADCDGLISRADLDHLRAELMDGDEAGVANADGGTVRSCSGADANGDGRITASDLTAAGALILGESLPDTPSGPTITFLGVAAADGTPAEAIPGGVVPIYQRPGGLGFQLVIEAELGPSKAPIGQNLMRFDPDRPEVQPDLQVLFSEDLSEGTPALCDDRGVPRVFPPYFAPTAEVASAVSDASCRFGVVSNPAASCTIDPFRSHTFVRP